MVGDSGACHPVVVPGGPVTEPILAPFRRVIPRIGMFDLSPLAAFLVISFLQQSLPHLL